MPNGWEAYTTAMNSIYNKKEEKYTRSNVCFSCAIYGQDGTVWAASDKWLPLTEYDHTVEGLDPSETKVVKINEFKIAQMVTDGVK